MKIICDSCGAKYSIADEKVQGKVFKIRCKKCSEVIVVEGTAGGEGSGGVDDYSSAYDGGGAAEWYVVIDGERVGPITPSDVEGYFSSGQLHEESYIWKDGLDDWVMLESVEEFGHLLTDSAGPNEKTMISDNPLHQEDRQEDEGSRQGMEAAGVEVGAGGGGGDATAVMDPEKFREQAAQQQMESEMAGDGQPGSQDSGGGGQSGFQDQRAPAEQGLGAEGQQGFGADRQQDLGAEGQQGWGAEPDPHGQENSAQSQGGQFGGYDSGAQEALDGGGYDEGGYDEGGYDEGGYDGEDGGMFAAFDESDGDDYEETDKGQGGGFSAEMNAGEDEEDLVAARSENSVLFSLSSVDQVDAVNKSDGPSGGGSAANDKSGLIDIQSLASSHAAVGQGGAGDDEEEFVSGTMSMPAMMPSGSQKSNTGLIVGISIGIALLLAIVGGVVVYLLMDDDEPVEDPRAEVVEQEEGEQDREQEEEDEAEAAAEAARQAAQEDEEDEDDEEDEEEVAEEDEDEEDEEEEVAQAEPSRGSGATGGGGGGGGGGAPSPSPQPTPQPDPEPQQQQGGGILSDLDRQSDPEPEEPVEELPERLSRSDVQNTIRRYSSQVSSCSRDSNPDGLSGNAMVRFVVAGSGNVSSADAQGEFSGTEVGRCIEGVVEGMRFPETQDDRRTINYPFSVR